MCEMILSLPCSTSTAVHRSVLGKQKCADANNERKTPGREEDPKDPAKISGGGTNEALT